MKLIGERNPVDVALMPIGGHYTMDRHDAVVAAEFVGAATVIPMHYDTFPPIETDAGAFKDEVESKTSSKVVVLSPGESHVGVGSAPGRLAKATGGGSHGGQRGDRNPVEDRAGGLPGDVRSRPDGGGRPDRRGQSAHLRGALPALGAPAVADTGARLHPRPRGLARADRPRKSASSACTGSPPSSSASRRSPRSSGRSCAPRRPRTRRSSSARRSPTRPATCASSSASTARWACSSPTGSPRCSPRPQST